MAAYSPFFDAKTSWFPNAWAYFDLYAIYVGSSVARQHPDWILHDAQGQPMYIPYGCSGGTCPQYAGNPANLAFRLYQSQAAANLIAHGYKGLWIDDVNMEFRVGDGSGNELPPNDVNTGTTMTWADWRRYIAEFTEQIRATIPAAEIVHNSIWYAGPDGVRDNDPFIQREIAAADFINCERGVGDPGLTGGTYIWSLSTFFSFIDRVHAAGRSIVLDEYSPADRDYALAASFLLTNGKDGLGEQQETPQNWWPGYDVSIGDPLGPRYSWNGLTRRDFQGGLVLLNEPQAAPISVTLPGVMSTIAGAKISSITLGASSGAVLLTPQIVASPPIRIKAGGSDYTDPSGVLWSADRYYDGGSVYSTTNSIGGTNAPALYQSERWQTGSFQYNIPVANGICNVNLKFSEIYFTQPGTRVFNVAINGQTVLANFDPLAQAGGPNIAVDRLFRVNVTSGLLNITFTPVVDFPTISAIEITF
jgi:hypothetical protein